MVFWSSFAKKVKQAVSQVSFDALKNRVQAVEQTNQAQDTQITNINSTLQTNSTNIVNLNNVKADKTALEVVDNKVDGVITGLQNGNIVNYTGVYSSSKNYSIAEATTYNNKWYVSNINNNVNHTPTGSSDAYWELLSEPTINLNPYLTKSEANSTYATINTTNSISSRVSSAETNITNLTNNKANKSDVYTKIESDNKYALKSGTLNYQNIPYANHFITVRNQVYFGNRRIHLYRMHNTNINLGLIENVVYRSNDNIFVSFSWYIDVYNNELKILLDRFDSTNDWTPNFSVDVYYRSQ